MAPAGPCMIGGTAAPALTSHFSVNQHGGDSWLSEHLGGVGAETEAPRGGHRLIQDSARTKPKTLGLGSALHYNPKGWKPAWGPWLRLPAPGHAPKGSTLHPRTGPGLDKQPWKDAKKRGWGHRSPPLLPSLLFPRSPPPPGLQATQGCLTSASTQTESGLRPHHLGLHVKHILHIFKSPCLR